MAVRKICKKCGKGFSLNLRDQDTNYCGKCMTVIGDKLIEVELTQSKQREQRLVAINEEAETGKATIEETQKQLAGLRKGLKELDTSQKGKLAALLEELPKSSPKAIIDKVFKTASPKRTQLIENIGKLEYVLDSLGRKQSDLELENRRLTNEAKEERLDGEAKAAFEVLGDWLGSYAQIEESFLELKQTIQDIAGQDLHWHQRFKECGFDQVYAVIGDSHLKPEGLRELSIAGLIERVSNLGDTYGKNPLEHSQELKILRQAGEDAHMFREDFIPGSFHQVEKA